MEVRGDQADLDVHHLRGGGPVPLRDGHLLPYARGRHHAGDPAGRDVPQGARPALRRGRRLPDHQAGPGLLPRALRLPVPLRQVRPGVRAGVQPGRDGEPGPGDLPRGVRLPREGDAGVVRGPRQCDPARDGAHVVRRPGHHGLVGRPVAEGVLRGLHGHVRQRRRDPLQGRLDHVRQPPQGVGVPRGPAAVHAPDHGGHPRPPGRQAELRRHHLRQGRLRAQAAGGVRRAGRVPGGRPPLLQAARVRQHAPGRPAVGAGRDQRPGHDGVVAVLAGDGRGERADPAGTPGGLPRRGAGGGAGGPRGPPRPAAAPDRGGPVPAHRGRRAGAVRAGGDGRGRPAHGGGRARRRRGPGPGAGQRRRPDLLQDPLRRRFAGHAPGAPGRPDRPAGAGPVLVGAVEHDPGRAAAGPGLHRSGAALRGPRVGHRCAPDAARVGALGAGALRGPRLAGHRRRAARRGRAAGAAGGRAGQRAPAGLGAVLRLDGVGRAGPGAADGAAGRHHGDRGPGRGPGAALGVPGAAGRARRGRRAVARRRTGPRRHRVRQAPPGALPGGPPLGGGQGAGVGAGRGVRHAVQRAGGGDDRGLRPALPAGVDRAVRAEVLRGHRAGVAGAFHPDRHGRGQRAVPGPPGPARDARGDGRVAPGAPGRGARAAAAGAGGAGRPGAGAARTGVRRGGRHPMSVGLSLGGR
ncbi:Membrane alanine aminopeptidase N [Streptomyces misionensis JCM 4497]